MRERNADKLKRLSQGGIDLRQIVPIKNSETARALICDAWSPLADCALDPAERETETMSGSGRKQKSVPATRMSEAGGEAEVIARKADISLKPRNA